MQSRTRRRILKTIGYSLAGLVALVGLAVAGAVFFLQGERMAAFVAKVLPEMRGKMEFRSIRWPGRLLLDIVAHRPTPMSVDGLKIMDPDGSVVLDVPHLDVKVEVHQLINGAGLFMHDLEVSPNSYWEFGRMKKTKKGIGFLAAFDPKTPAPPAPPKPAGAKPEKGFAIRIFNAQLHGLRVVFNFPHVWGFDLRDVHSPAWLQVEDGFCGWEAVGLEARQGGFLTVLDQVLPFDRVKVKQVATLREYADDIFLDLEAGQTGRTTLVGKGFFNGIYGADSVSAIHMHAEFHDAVDALTAVAKPMGIEGLRLGGDHAQLAADLMGPYESLAIKADLAGLDAGYTDYAARNLVLRAGLKFDPKSKASVPNMTLEELSFSPPDGGRFTTKLDLTVPKLATQIRFDRFNTTTYLPAGLRKLAAGQVHGKLDVTAEFDETMSSVKQVALSGLDLDLTRSGKGMALPRSVRVSGQASATPEQVSTSGLHIDVPGAGVQVKGKVELAKRLLALGLEVSAADLPRLLTSLGVDPLAKQAALSVDVTGSMDQPQANGQIQVRGIGGVGGIPAVPSFESRFHLAHGTLSIDSLGAEVAGGSLAGSGNLTLFEQTVQHTLRSPGLDFRLQGKQISLESLIAAGIASGKVSFDVAATGPLDHAKVRFTVPEGTSVTVLGQTWEIGGIDVEADREGLVVRLLRVTGGAGGEIRIEGHLRFSPKAMPIDWRIKIDKLPLAAILAAARVDAPVKGALSVDLHVTGDTKAPSIEGVIALLGVEAAGIRLGNAQLNLTTVERDLQVEGDLFGRLKLSARGSQGPDAPHAHATLSFNHLAAEDYVSELKPLDVRTSLSGQVMVDWRLDQPVRVEAVISELDASIAREVTEPGGKVTTRRVGVKNGSDLRVLVNGSRITLVPARLLTEGGEFALEGELEGEALHARLSGHVDLELVQPLLRQQLEKLGGAVALDVKVAGTASKPLVDGTLKIARPVHAIATAFQPEITIPSGAVELRSDGAELRDLAISVAGSTLRLNGKAGLAPDFSPTTLSLEAEGEISASLLEAVAPDAVSDVAGRARIKARVAGTLADPEVGALIDLGEISMRLRGISGQVAVESGRVELSTHELLLREVKVKLNDEGRLLIGAAGVRPGRVQIVSLRPALVLGEIDLPLKGERLGYHSSSVVVDDLSFVFGLSGDLQQEDLSLEGDVRLVSGRYQQDFNVRNLMLSPRINESESGPGLEAIPLLKNLQLALRVRTLGEGFYVHNNLTPGEIYLTMDLMVGGTLAAPTIAGDLRPTDGRFHIIGLRGDFDLVPNVSYVSFVPTKSIVRGDTPELNLEAQNQLTDAFGNERTVRMRISGPIGQSAIDLSTADGLDRNQTLMLLLSGRTADNIAGGGRAFSINAQSGIDMVGQASRDAVSNLVEPYIDDTLQLLTGHKLNLRPTIGADGVELKVLAHATRELSLDLSYLRGFQTLERYHAQTSLWVRDYVTGRLIGERLTFSPQQGITEQTTTLSLGLTLDYPLRLPFP